MENRSSEGYVIRQEVDDTPLNSDGSIDYGFTIYERLTDVLALGWPLEEIVYVRVTIEDKDAPDA